MPSFGQNLNALKREVAHELYSYIKENFDTDAFEAFSIEERRAEVRKYNQENPTQVTEQEYPLIFDALGIEGDTPQEVIQAWVTDYQEFKTLARSLQRIKRRAKVELRDATTIRRVFVVRRWVKVALKGLL